MTDDTIQRLKEWGYDTDGALQRLFGEKEMLIELANEYLSRIPLQALQDALVVGDCQRAFEIAHGMKGVLANLGLTPLYKPASEITEVFRDGGQGDVSEAMERLRTATHELEQLLEQ